MIVIGGGLGGLVTAALAAKRGPVTLFERSRTLGGRFRNISHEGYQLTTGALHMIPHGSRGPLARLLAEAGASCTIIDSYPWATFERDGIQERFSSIRSSLPFMRKAAAARLLFEMRHFSGPACSTTELFERRFDLPLAHELVRCFLGWSLSCTPDELPARDFYAIVKNVFAYGGSGIPLGGCGAVVDALKGALSQNGVLVRHRAVRFIIVEDGQVAGVEDEDGIVYEDRVVVSDIGPKGTLGLLANDAVETAYRKSVQAIPESGGIKITLGTSSSLIPHSGILFPLGAERVEGLNQVTNADPSLAPEGRHMVMSHQTLRGKNIHKETAKGLADLEELFGNRDYEVLATQAYFGKNPVNRASQGNDVLKCPVRGLFFVGDGAKGRGGIEVEGIALGIMAQRHALAI